MKTQLIAILNLTPDSFSDGGRLSNVSQALGMAEHALAAGANILEVGGESTRPGAFPVAESEELKRVLPVIETIHRAFPEALISIDTRKATVAAAAIQAGVRMVNDVSGLSFDSQLAGVVAASEAHLVIMHSQGTPDTMQNNPIYPEGVLASVYAFFQERIQWAMAAGIQKERLILDPGFGFGKTVAHNLTLFQQLPRFLEFGIPLLVGTSRKSFLTLGNRELPVDEREALTAASVAMAVERGVQYIRVHDVETHAPVLRWVEAVKHAG